MSRLKEVLERRLFRNNGMLGSENPQGILNSSNELANTVRMQNGGQIQLGEGPAAISYSGVPIPTAEELEQSDVAAIPVLDPLMGVADQGLLMSDPFAAIESQETSLMDPFTVSETLQGEIPSPEIIPAEEPESLEQRPSGETITLEEATADNIKEFQERQTDLTVAEPPEMVTARLTEQRLLEGPPEETDPDITIEQDELDPTHITGEAFLRAKKRSIAGATMGPEDEAIIETVEGIEEVRNKYLDENSSYEDARSAYDHVKGRRETPPTINDYSKIVGERLEDSRKVFFDNIKKELDEIEELEEPSEEELAARMESAKEQFINALPEYEGKTQFEKGMTFAKLGMAIAAGKSPHAIQNIANGFLAMADEFTTDDKEKRAYDRQIKLSAANFALKRNKEDRDRLNKLTDDRSTFKRNLILEGLKIVVEYDKALATLNANALKELRRPPTETSKAREDYQRLLGEYRGSIAMKANLSRIITLSFKKGSNAQIGMLSQMGDWLNSGFNAAEMDPDKWKRDWLNASGDRKERKILMGQLSAELAPVILGESGRTISDADRKRVDAIMSHYADLITGITSSPRAIRVALKGLENHINSQILRTSTGLNSIEQEWTDLYTKGSVPMSAIFKQKREAYFGRETPIYGAGTKGLTGAQQVLTFSEIWDPEKNTFSEKYYSLGKQI